MLCKPSLLFEGTGNSCTFDYKLSAVAFQYLYYHCFAKTVDNYTSCDFINLRWQLKKIFPWNIWCLTSWLCCIITDPRVGSIRSSRTLEGRKTISYRISVCTSCRPALQSYSSIFGQKHLIMYRLNSFHSVDIKLNFQRTSPGMFDLWVLRATSVYLARVGFDPEPSPDPDRGQQFG